MAAGAVARLAWMAFTAGCVSLPACVPVVSSTGRLDGGAIKTISLQLPEGMERCPGSSFAVQIRASGHDGKVYDTTQGVGWGNFDTEVRGGTITPQGRVQLSADPRLTWRRPARIRAALIDKGSVATELDLPISYRCHYEAHLGAQKKPKQTLRITATLNLIGTRRGQPVAQVQIRAPATGRAGTFYLSPGAKLTLHHALEERWPATLTIYARPDATAFAKAIELARPGGLPPRIISGDPPRQNAGESGAKSLPP